MRRRDVETGPVVIRVTAGLTYFAQQSPQKSLLKFSIIKSSG
jgi:hypothetical protein